MKRTILICILLLLLGVIPACAQSEVEETQNHETQGTEAPTEGERTVFEMTEEELRQKISEAGAGADAPEQVIACYEELLARGLFSEEDYANFAGVYEETGDREKQRDILLKLLHLYPSEEYVQRISAIIVQKDNTDRVCETLANQIIAYLEQGEAVALKELIESEEWNAVFQDGLKGVEIRTRYCDEENVLQIRTGYFVSEITCLQKDGTLYYYITDQTDITLASAKYEDAAYNGEATVSHYDTEGNLVLEYRGTIEKNICVDTISVYYDGKEFTGSLNEDGTTAEKQESKVTEAGGVVYARSANGNTYLYIENLTVDELLIDCVFIGLPIYEAWE